MATNRYVTCLQREGREGVPAGHAGARAEERDGRGVGREPLALDEQEGERVEAVLVGAALPKARNYREI